MISPKGRSSDIKKSMIILGGGGHARVLKEILSLRKCRVLGYTDIKPMPGMPVPYLGNDDVLKKYPSNKVLVVNGIGSVHLPLMRQKIYEKFKSKGYCFAAVIHPCAVISADIVLGEGVQVMAGVVINTGARIGENVIINTLSGVDHDCLVDAHTHIAPGVNISGDVCIGRGCHIGTGAKIIQGISIGNGALIAAGATVVKNVPAGGQAAGVPARNTK